MLRLALATTMLLAVGATVEAADVVKIGNLTQLSGPFAASGNETKRGIDLALEELGNKVGGVPVRYYPVDDKTNPAEAINGASISSKANLAGALCSRCWANCKSRRNVSR